MVVVWSNYWLVFPSLAIVLIILLIRGIFLKTSRDLKRIESQARSPLFSHLAASTQGITTIRAMKAEEQTIAKFNRLQDAHSASWFLFISGIRCFTTWIGTVSSIFLTVITATFLAMTDTDGKYGHTFKSAS